MFTPIHSKGRGAAGLVGKAFVLRTVGRGGGRSGDKKDGGREGEGGGIYIINYNFITWSQFLRDLLFRRALMNNKKRERRERKKRKKGGGVIEVIADTATSWHAPVRLQITVRRLGVGVCVCVCVSDHSQRGRHLLKCLRSQRVFDEVPVCHDAYRLGRLVDTFHDPRAGVGVGRSQRKLLNKCVSGIGCVLY